MSSVVFFDIETNIEGTKILDIGALRSDESVFHKNSVPEFVEFSKNCDFLCGHNVVKHDLKVIQKQIGNPSFGLEKTIDTLLFSPLLFPNRPY
ncbi:MAG TPA: hypothetical protein PLZ45_15470, partial [Ferruginibacter sp.]|nr:hypothetical protein [Ferruginibacter sp.]